VTDIPGLHSAFTEAELHADTARLDTLLADDFVSVGERGHQLDKHQWIARHGDFVYRSISTSELDVRQYDRAAIVRSAQRSSALWQGKPLTLSVRVSEVWVELAAGWRLAGVQFSTLDP
jgi:hypothetical protein